MSITIQSEIKKGELFKFPENKIREGLRYGEKFETYKNLKLFKDENGWWWIYYSRERKTGRFVSKPLAIGWFVNKGR